MPRYVFACLPTTKHFTNRLQIEDMIESGGVFLVVWQCMVAIVVVCSLYDFRGCTNKQVLL